MGRSHAIEDARDLNMDAINSWYKTLQPREKMLVASVLGVAALAIVYLALFGPLANALHARQERVAEKRKDLVWMLSMQNAVRMAAASRGNQGINGESLVVMVNRTAQQAGIGSALVNQAPQGDNGIRVRLEGANFDAMVSWLGALEQQYGVRADTASVDRTDKIGIVNASLMLTRGAI
jgi:general secretion pathway protein M